MTRSQASSLLLRSGRALTIIGGVSGVVGSVPLGALGFATWSIRAYLASAIAMALGGFLSAIATRLGQAEDTRPYTAAGPTASLVFVRLFAVTIAMLPLFMTARAQIVAPLYPNGIAQSAMAITMPWVAMAMSDLFCGFLLSSLWILYRETRLWLAWLLVVGLWMLGNDVLGLYILALTFAPSASIPQILIGAARLRRLSTVREAAAGSGLVPPSKL